MDLFFAGILALRNLNLVRIFAFKPGSKRNYIPREFIINNSIHNPYDFRKKSNKLTSIINNLNIKPALEYFIRNLNIFLRLGIINAAVDNLDITAAAKKNKKSFEFNIIITVTKTY
jgi:hypothetical protein